MSQEKFRLYSQDTTLLIIDQQENLLRAMSVKDKVIKNTRLLLSLAREFALPVVVSEQYPRGLGATMSEIQEMLPDDVIKYEKTSFTACSAGHRPFFDQLNRKSIIVTGTETHVCVYQTVRDLLTCGYQVHVVRDAVCSRFKENYLNGLDLMQQMGAVINNTETIIFDMLQCAGTDPFKKISPLLKA